MPSTTSTSSSNREYKMLVDGAMVGASASDSYDVINPSTGAPFATAPHCPEQLCSDAVDAASKAFRTWQAVPMAKRQEAMRAVLERVKEGADELAELLVEEQGKPLAAAKGEVQGCLYLLEKAATLELTPDVYSDTAERRVEVRRKPLGVVACITPWNFPLFCSVQKWAPAIVLGNTVVHKPSPFTPLTGLRMAEMVKDALPRGVLNAIGGDDQGQEFNVGRYLSNHPKVAMVSFTGSGPTGQAIMAACAPALRRVVLECGGNDPAIVRSDADVKEAAAGVFQGAFVNSGQVCCAAKRCLVHEDLYDAFRTELVRIAGEAESKFGDGFDDGVEFGPLNNKMQLDKVSELVDDARAAGGTVLCGGRRRDGPGYFYEPTIVEGVREGVRLWDEEQFGPVLPIAPFSDDDEAVARANDSEYGLGGSVWGTDVAAANDVASRILSGTVWVNEHASLTGAPFGGFRQSGIGRELGKADVEAFTECQTLSLAKD